MDKPPQIVPKSRVSGSPEPDSAWWRGGLKAALALPASVYLTGGPTALAASVIALPPPLVNASPKRKSDYLAGRHWAFEALRAAGCQDVAPPAMGEDRLPQWPHGWLGSITHSNGEAIAAVSTQGATRLLGIDVEILIEPASVAGIADLVALEGELGLIDGGDANPSQALTILFSAKESLYKALYPDTQRFMDFSAAKLHVFAPGLLGFTLTEDWHPAWRAGARLSVHYTTRGDRVYTALHLAQSAA